LKTDHLKLQQLKLVRKIKIQRLNRKVRKIAGVDAAVTRDHLIGCIGVFLYPSMELLEEVSADCPMTVPYVPNFLSFRELPVFIKCFRRLKTKPDLMLIDGQGIAHPRALGLATHLGIVLNTPTIGCAKSHLFGEFSLPNSSRGSYEYLFSKGEKIGIVLRTQNSIKPLFISPGHLVDIDDCRRFVLSSALKYRLPEPIRHAHQKAGSVARRMHV
jgi:deoxyribonuclease V